jgi:hypothetical protein
MLRYGTMIVVPITVSYYNMVKSSALADAPQDVASSSSSTSNSRSSSLSPTPPSCEEYNTFWQVMQPAGRSDRCNSVGGCKFVGGAMRGKCLDQEAALALIKSKTKVTLYAELGTDSSGSGDSSDAPIRVIVRELAAASAVDSMRNSHEIVNVLARDLVLNAFSQPESQMQLGLSLQKLFSYKSVVDSTRWLAYWGIYNDYSLENISLLAHEQKRYFMNKHHHIYQSEGYDYTEEQLVSLVKWFFETDYARQVVVPQLVDIGLKENMTVKNSGIRLSGSIYNKEMKEWCSDNLKTMSLQTLEQDKTKIQVKDALVQFLNEIGSETQKKEMKEEDSKIKTLKTTSSHTIQK